MRLLTIALAAAVHTGTALVFAPRSVRRLEMPRRAGESASGAAEEDSEEDARAFEVFDAVRAARAAGEAPEGGRVIDATPPPPKHRDPDPSCGEADLTDRFLVAARALRGEYDPEDASDDTEANSNLLAALVEEYPAPYSFTAVGRVDAGGDDAALVAALAALVRKECGGADVESATPRLGGKFVSVRLRATVESPDTIRRVFDALRADARVKMAF